MVANIFSHQGLYLWSLFPTGCLNGVDSLKQITSYFTGDGEVQHVLSRPCKDQTGGLSGSPLCAALQGHQMNVKRGKGCDYCKHTKSECGVKAN